MKIKEVLVRRDGKMVHGVRTAGTTIHFALCGYEAHVRNETHSIHDYDVRFVINCKRCKKVMEKMRRDESLSKSLMENIHDEVEAKKATVMDGKDIFYEVRMKDGTNEYVFDVMSAQEAAEIVQGNMGIPLTDIECIHKLAVVKVIFPTVTVKFEE